MLIEEYRPEINNLQAKLEEMKGSLDIVNKEDRISELEHRMGDPTFWDDPEKAQKIAQDVNSLKEEVDGFHKLASDVDDLEAGIYFINIKTDKGNIVKRFIKN